MIARPHPLHLSAGSFAGFLAALGMGASAIVFSEPAPADAMMMAVIFGLPILGVVRFGRMAFVNLALWLGLVGTGLAGVCLSTNIDTALTHQLVTLFLALGAFVLAGYIAEDPEPRIRLILIFYVVACLIATAAAFVGYFKILPSAYELFTNYGRARGTFKDPNVYGAAMAPGIVAALWALLRDKPWRANLAAAVALFLALGLLISFSRGAWFTAAVSCLLLVWVAFVRSRRRSDFVRMGVVATLGSVGMVLVLGAALRSDAVGSLLEERASLDQSYDMGPDGRFGGQAKAIDLILEHPFGVGTHSFRDTYHVEEAHNVYLSMFLNAGWVGGVLYILSVVATLLAGLKGSFRNGALQGPFLVVTAAFAGLVLEGFVIDTDHWRHFFILVGCIWGLTDAQAPALDPPRRDDALEPIHT